MSVACEACLLCAGHRVNANDTEHTLDAVSCDRHALRKDQAQERTVQNPTPATQTYPEQSSGAAVILC
jgi:hypothetical protein